jgi:hypothetical protein
MNEQDSEIQENTQKAARVKQVQRTLSLIFFVVGIGLCLIAISIDYIGLDLTPGFGAIQMLQLLLGVSCLTLSGFLYLRTLRQPDAPKSLQADIGIRLAATGLVFMYVAGFADLLGIGTHVNPSFPRPFVGPLQLIGLFLGAISIIAGMLLYHSSRRISGGRSSMEFLVNGTEPDEEATVQN